MIVLGIILLIIGFVAKIPVLWTIGIIAVVLAWVIASPDGDILWVSGALPGSVHDKKAEWIWGVLHELEAAGLVHPGGQGLPGQRVREDPVQGEEQARIPEAGQ